MPNTFVPQFKISKHDKVISSHKYLSDLSLSPNRPRLQRKYPKRAFVIHNKHSYYLNNRPINC